MRRMVFPVPEPPPSNSEEFAGNPASLRQFEIPELTLGIPVVKVSVYQESTG